jgi:glycosyltransferase involved in cell wall biosynthesis
MKLFFDARYIRTDFHDGISRFSTELAAALSQQAHVTFIICNIDQLKLLPLGVDYVTTHAPTSVLEPFTSLRLNRYHPDVVFSPMQTMGALGRRFKLILTLHDMIYYRHRTPPHQFNPLLRAGWWLYHATYLPQRLALNSADLVATVSQTSKEDILAAKLTMRPVIVVPNAPQQLRQYLDGDVATLEPKNLIYMGSFMEYKNVETLIRAMEFLSGFKLHLLSRISPGRKAELEKIVPHGAKVIFHNGVSDKEYAEKLADNALLVSASLDEGYGLPIAEASVLGVPAIISNLPIFHEVAGEGALYFNPTDSADFAKKVQKATKSSNYHELSRAATKQSQKFSWQTSATTLLEAIESLLQ